MEEKGNERTDGPFRRSRRRKSDGQSFQRLGRFRLRRSELHEPLSHDPTILRGDVSQLHQLVWKGEIRLAQAAARPSDDFVMVAGSEEALELVRAQRLPGVFGGL